MHVGDTALPLENPGALKLDLPGGQALEQTAPFAEEHRNDVELELVENAVRDGYRRLDESSMRGQSTGPVNRARVFSRGNSA
jgi:hypothetical protein